MKESYYTIKEASSKVGVESHVLRYWEEELKMDIHRNQMGHRYYTEHDIEVLSKVKKLKDKGMQLKAIRSYIEKRKRQMENGTASDNSTTTEIVPVKSNTNIMSNEEKLEQFQNIMNKILSNAIKENNELIGKTAGEHAASAVVTQFQGMSKEQEERAEERFRKLDQTLREIQLARKEAAAAGMRPVDRRKQKRLNRKNKLQNQPEKDDQEDRNEESIKDSIGISTMTDSEMENEAGKSESRMDEESIGGKNL